MDVNHTNGTDRVRAYERYREAMAELVRRTRGKVENARDAAESAGERSETRRADALKQAHHAQRRATIARADAKDDRAPVDTVEISGDLAALARVRDGGDDEAGATRVRPKIARLMHAYRNGELHTPERLERAAERLLRGVRDGAPELAGGDGADPAAG